MEQLQYPVGRFVRPDAASAEQRAGWIAVIESLPADLRRVLEGLDEVQLSTPYRPGGWTARQVVHHLADSHMNASIRMRLALTEDAPTIKPYREDRWAELVDAREEDVAVSLQLLEALHRRWTRLLTAMSDEQYARRYRHPEMGEMEMGSVLALYAWHCRHHLGHIRGLRERAGW